MPAGWRAADEAEVPGDGARRGRNPFVLVNYSSTICLESRRSGSVAVQVPGPEAGILTDGGRSREEIRW